MAKPETFKYSVILERGAGALRPDVCIFYDEDRSVALKEMQKYVKSHGFTVDDRDGRFTIADVLLRKSKLTGEIVSETPYRKLFDAWDKLIKEIENENFEPV